MCLYIPPNISCADASAVHDFIVHCCDHYSLTLKNHRTILCGDFNLFNTSTLCSALGLTDIVRAPTCGDSRLDKILVSDCFTTSSASSTVGAPIANSDHNSVCATIKLQSTDSPPAIYKKVYDMRRRFVDKFINNITCFDYDSITCSNSSVDDICSSFQHSITSCFNSSIPFKLVPISVRDKPWITPFIKSLIHERWTASRDRNFTKYRRLAILVKSKIAEAKKSWVKRATNVSQLWSNVHSVLGSNEPNPLYSLYFDFASGTDLVNAINNQFASVFDLHEPPNTNNFVTHLTDEWFFDVTEEQVLSEILNYPNNKAPGYDEVPNCICKAA